MGKLFDCLGEKKLGGFGAHEVWQLSHGVLGFSHFDDSLLIDAHVPHHFRKVVSQCAGDIEDACLRESAVC